jgi:sodium/potassium-transporting ATPase subunit alpha
MSTRNVLVKDLTGVETLGAITLLATDKTGTLTRNQMTATNIWTSLTMYRAARNTHGMEPAFPHQQQNEKEIINIALLCTRAKFSSTDVPIEERAVLGDATEAGLLRFASRYVDDCEKVRFSLWA